MMKKLYLGLLSALLGTMLGFGFVKGDIINPNWNFSERNNLEDSKDSEITTEGKNGDKVYGRLLGDCENRIICAFSHDIWFDVVNSGNRFFIFLIFALLLMSLSVLLLYSVFNKLGEKGWKTLIPVKNLYSLASLVNTKKIGVIWGGVAIFWWLGINLWMYTIPPCMFIWDGGDGSYINDGIVCGFRNIFHIISCLPAIIVFFVYDYFALISFYRLFRKFGWNRGHALLGTIFFPIGACVLGFGSFKCQGENLEKKEGNN